MPRRNQANNNIKEDKNSIRNLFMFLVFLTVFSVVLWYIITNYFSGENSLAPFKDIIKDDNTPDPDDDDDKKEDDNGDTLGPVETNSRLLLFILIPVVIVMVVGLFFGGRLLKRRSARVAASESSKPKRTKYTFRIPSQDEISERSKNAIDVLNNKIKKAQGNGKDFFTKFRDNLIEKTNNMKTAFKKESIQLKTETKNEAKKALEAAENVINQTERKTSNFYSDFDTIPLND